MEKFQCIPTVYGEPHFRFYAGVTLIAPGGYRIGTICVLDFKKRDLSESQRYGLEALGRQVIAQMELKLQNEELQVLNMEKNRFLGKCVERSIDRLDRRVDGLYFIN